MWWWWVDQVVLVVCSQTPLPLLLQLEMELGAGNGLSIYNLHILHNFRFQITGKARSSLTRLSLTLSHIEPSQAFSPAPSFCQRANSCERNLCVWTWLLAGSLQSVFVKQSSRANRLQLINLESRVLGRLVLSKIRRFQLHNLTDCFSQKTINKIDVTI